MPYYDVPAVAEALDLPHKQLDNLISRNDLDGVDRQRRGVTRRMTLDAVVTIALGLELATHLRAPIPAALALSARLQQVADDGMTLGDFLRIRVDLEALRAATQVRLQLAVEAVGRRRRGRAPAHPDSTRDAWE